MARGGKQPGAGRPKGSITKPRFSDFITPAEVKKLVAKAIEMAKAGNDNMLKFCLEQNFGKAMQPVEGDFKGNIVLSFDNAFTSSKTENNS